MGRLPNDGQHRRRLSGVMRSGADAGKAGVSVRELFANPRHPGPIQQHRKRWVTGTMRPQTIWGSTIAASPPAPAPLVRPRSGRARVAFIIAPRTLVSVSILPPALSTCVAVCLELG